MPSHLQRDHAGILALDLLQHVRHARHLRLRRVQPRARLGQPLLEALTLSQPLGLVALLLVVLELNALQLRLLLRVEVVELGQQRLDRLLVDVDLARELLLRLWNEWVHAKVSVCAARARRTGRVVRVLS